MTWRWTSRRRTHSWPTTIEAFWPGPDSLASEGRFRHASFVITGGDHVLLAASLHGLAQFGVRR